MDGFKAINRAPYNDMGRAYISAWLQDPISLCLRNGVIDPGLDLSESQRVQIMQEVGQDITTTLFTKATGTASRCRAPTSEQSAARPSCQFSIATQGQFRESRRGNKHHLAVDVAIMSHVLLEEIVGSLDLTGQVYGRLTVIRRAENVNGRTRWHCLCSCGNETDVATGLLRSGGTRSCGCLSKENRETRVLT